MRHWRDRSSPPAPAPSPAPSPAPGDPDQAWKALSLVNDWVKHAETKGAATLAAAGVTGGVLYNLVKDQSRPSIYLTVPAVVCAVGVLAAALFALLALTPRTNPLGGFRKRPVPVAPTDDGHDDSEEPDTVNLLFFADITRRYAHDIPTYTDVLGALTSDPEALTRHISRQVHANAGVAHRKFVWAERAIWGLAVCLAALAAVAGLVGKPFGAG